MHPSQSIESVTAIRVRGIFLCIRHMDKAGLRFMTYGHQLKIGAIIKTSLLIQSMALEGLKCVLNGETIQLPLLNGLKQMDGRRGYK